LESSSLSGEGVEEAFMIIIKEIMNKQSSEAPFQTKLQNPAM